MTGCLHKFTSNKNYVNKSAHDSEYIQDINKCDQFNITINDCTKPHNNVQIECTKKLMKMNIMKIKLKV